MSLCEPFLDPYLYTSDGIDSVPEETVRLSKHHSIHILTLPLVFAKYHLVTLPLELA